MQRISNCLYYASRTLLNAATLRINSSFIQVAKFSSISNGNIQTHPILNAKTPMLEFSCGMKVKGKPRRRCKDCYFVVRDQRLYVMCKSYGRHKQMSIVPKPKNTWMLTHASQSPIRPW